MPRWRVARPATAQLVPVDTFVRSGRDAAPGPLIDTMLVARELSARVGEVLPLDAAAEVDARVEGRTATDRLLLQS
ncbi:MAG: hypothetical protein M0Z95_16330 [Actinomycetota bacterium]|nr:hypothetical protein [Actinomycetota bacterium]